jgi:ABC-type transport system involved in multi-copper enzyme maturation permease subunit
MGFWSKVAKIALTLFGGALVLVSGIPLLFVFMGLGNRSSPISFNEILYLIPPVALFIIGFLFVLYGRFTEFERLHKKSILAILLGVAFIFLVINFSPQLYSVINSANGIQQNCPSEITDRLRTDISSASKTGQLVPNGNYIFHMNSFTIGNYKYEPQMYQDSVDVICHKGSREGENLNYIYCDGLGYVYHNPITNGTIGKKTTYDVHNVVIDPTNNFGITSIVCDYDSILNH